MIVYGGMHAPRENLEKLSNLVRLGVLYLLYYMFISEAQSI